VKRTLIGALVALALSACGSTVPTAVQQATGSTALDQPAVSPSTDPRTGVPAPDVDPAAPAPVAATPPTPGSAPPYRTGAKRDLLIGVEYSADYEQTMASLGFGGLASGDIPALVRTIVADLNRRGVLGKVSVLFHDTSTADSQSNPSSAAQAVCEDFLQDHKVDFALTPSAIQTDCFVQAKVPVVQYAAITPNGADRAFLAPRAPYLFAPTSFETDTLYPLYLERLAAQGYFPTGAKVGLLWSSHPSEQRQSAQLLRLLRQRKVEVASTFEYDATNAASITSSVSSSVLRFRAAGVDHVISLDGNVGLFMIQAEQQQYRPRYAINTFMGPSSVQATLVPPRQLRGAVGVGWEPVNDVPEAYDDLRTPARATCDAYVKASGQNLAGKRTAQFAAYSVCDGLRILVEGGSVEASAMRVALGALGTRFPSALNLLSAYGPQQSAGAVAVRDLRYEQACACFRYAGKQLHR